MPQLKYAMVNQLAFMRNSKVNWVYLVVILWL